MKILMIEIKRKQIVQQKKSQIPYPPACKALSLPEKLPKLYPQTKHQEKIRPGKTAVISALINIRIRTVHRRKQQAA